MRIWFSSSMDSSSDLFFALPSESSVMLFVIFHAMSMKMAKWYELTRSVRASGMQVDTTASLVPGFISQKILSDHQIRLYPLFYSSD
jgi:hypothetical protein